MNKEINLYAMKKDFKGELSRQLVGLVVIKDEEVYNSLKNLDCFIDSLTLGKNGFIGFQVNSIGK